MKFKTKLNVILVLVAITTLFIGVVISFVGARNVLNNRLKAHLESVVMLKENSLKKFVRSRISDIRLMLKDRHYIKIFLEGSKAERRNILKERLFLKKGFIEFFILDLDGQISVSTDENQVGKIKSDENYFNRGKEGPFVQFFYYDISLQQPAMTISAPINDDQERFSGLLIGRVDLKEISAIMTERTGLGETGETYLVNRFNIMVTESRFEKGLALKKYIYTQGVRDCLKEKRGFALYDNYRGDPVFGFYDWISEIEVGLLAEISQKEAFGPIQQLRNIIIIAGLGIVVFIIICGSWFSRTISKPIEKLIEGIERIDNGDLNYRVELKTNDEHKKLAVAFNQMTDRRQLSEEALKRSHDELEIRVAERTVELANINQQLKQEVKERKQAEKEFEDIFNLSPDLVAVCTTEGKFLKVNPTWEKVLGYTQKEILDLGWAKLVHPDDVEKTNKEVENQLKGRSIVNFVNRYKCKDGSYKTFEWQASFTTEGIVHATARDITERNRAEEALRENEEQLRQAQKLESVGRLAGGVAHDFNNLLTTILGYSELIYMEQDLNDTTREGVQEIKKSAERAASLTQQLLAFSRKQIMRPQQIDLNKLIKNFRKMLTRLIHENITFSTKLDTGIGKIKADPVQIEQVIMNLAVNARDAMPDGGTFTIETHKVHLDESYRQEHPQVSPGDYVLLAVSDTGHGMDEETMDYIFDPFYTTKGVGKGTGLGLSTVYGIVKQSEGHILVYSEPDHGTTFKIYLPAIEETEKQQESLPENRDVMGGTETILLVEDEESLRKMAGKILEGYGYSVVVAKSGLDALAILSESEQLKIDCLVTDVIMPEMGGKELSKKLLEEYPKLKMLFVSGYTANVIAHHGVLDKGVSFLQKPFSPQSLAEKVREVLDEG